MPKSAWYDELKTENVIITLLMLPTLHQECVFLPFFVKKRISNLKIIDICKKCWDIDEFLCLVASTQNTFFHFLSSAV